MKNKAALVKIREIKQSPEKEYQESVVYEAVVLKMKASLLNPSAKEEEDLAIGTFKTTEGGGLIFESTEDKEIFPASKVICWKKHIKEIDMDLGMGYDEVREITFAPMNGMRGENPVRDNPPMDAIPRRSAFQEYIQAQRQMMEEARQRDIARRQREEEREAEQIRMAMGQQTQRTIRDNYYELGGYRGIDRAFLADIDTYTMNHQYNYVPIRRMNNIVSTPNVPAEEPLSDDMITRMKQIAKRNKNKKAWQPNMPTERVQDRHHA